MIAGWADPEKDREIIVTGSADEKKSVVSEGFVAGKVGTKEAFGSNRS